MSQKLNTFQRVRELEGWKSVAFGAALLERMLPNYQLFCEVSEYDDGTQFRKSLNSIWEWLSVPKAKINFTAQLEKVEVLTPDASEYEGWGVYPAIDTAMALSALIMLIKGDDEGGAVVVSKLSQGTVDAYLQASSEGDMPSEEVKDHPLMQWEVSFQNELLDRLTSAKRNAESVKELKAFALEEGMSNIGLEVG